jgi:hypothetical protein
MRNETLMLRNKVENLLKELNRLNREGIINNDTYSDYALLILTVSTQEQFNEIVHDLTEIQHPVYRALSLPRPSPSQP